MLQQALPKIPLKVMAFNFYICLYKVDISSIIGPYQIACIDDCLPPPRDKSPTQPAEIDLPNANPSIQDQELFHSCIR